MQMDFCWTEGEKGGNPIFFDLCKVSPEQPPHQVDNFSGIDGRLLESVEFKKPTLVQRFLIPTIFSGRNAVICASIGSGKTTGYLLPVFSRILEDGDIGHGDVESGVVCPSVLILTPPDKVSDVHLSCLKLSEGTSIGTAVIAVTQERNVPDIKNTAVVISDIGKLHSLKKPDENICLDRLKVIVLDNVDGISSFLFSPADYFSKHFPNTKIQVVMVTSWLTENIDLHANSFVGDRFLLYSDHRLGLENVAHRFEEVMGSVSDRLQKLQEIVPTEKTIVFAKSDETCTLILGHLFNAGFEPKIVPSGNGGSGGDVFIEEGHSSLLVATFDACRKMRLPEVGHVIMFDLPSCRLDYCQLISRVQGKRATTLVGPLVLKQKGVLKKIREMF